ncbi:hypothetical protein DB31_0922 [Hyalangium minutum]|uniref:Uncharacterized protein n=1 Tax=Hyalangium minutum TaxID=394096 RepID=A0A085WFI6_9BACT|nr:hypothetical protein DB31_0922 [Hyalangium minutum]
MGTCLARGARAPNVGVGDDAAGTGLGRDRLPRTRVTSRWGIVAVARRRL